MTNGQVLSDLHSHTAELDELARLRAENAALKAKANKRAMAGVRFKVSEKGAISIYGMGRFPITLYKSQFLRLVQCWDDLKDFATDNDHLLAVKD